MTENTHRVPKSWNSHSLSDVWCVREVNEDALVELTSEHFWAVADGMGGHKLGDIASKKIIERLSLIKARERLNDYVTEVEDALIQANQQLLEYAQRRFKNQTVGSTVVCLLVSQYVGVALWVGDSRLYRYRNNQLHQLTRDHSQVEEMLQMGLITPEEAENHPHKNLITRAVGVESALFVDIDVFNVQAGDTYLLCSDGLYNSVRAADIRRMLGHPRAEACASDLMKTSLDSGADDNVSIIVVKGELAS